ncbi:hypothetical protein FIBSPDRAFT_799995 [Athelia psychrophila]|uniref:Vps72/YL1 C-terminal domain-containing protein n=1 Tax=Athelia psychrophila TaxID=1759441 RepID=A0A166AJC1_9AGAM|nr:hypothetical protein FIBSPDRAFT_799995 [Fibularhizoctonia sp. CBS 109695]
MPPKGGGKKKAAAAAGDSGAWTPHIPTLGEQLSYLHSPRPFKNPHYTKNVNRRAKNLKAVLSQERERERLERERKRLEREQRAENGEDAMDVDDEDADALTSYAAIEAPPSFMPQRHYCDITGLEAPYTDPATGLRYHDKSVYELIKGLSIGASKDYLAARGVNPIVK